MTSACSRISSCGCSTNGINPRIPTTSAGNKLRAPITPMAPQAAARLRSERPWNTEPSIANSDHHDRRAHPGR